mgnify:CR=1 FL=1
MLKRRVSRENHALSSESHLNLVRARLVRDRPEMTSTRRGGGWGQAVLTICWREGVGGVKILKSCWRHFWMVPNWSEHAHVRELMTFNHLGSNNTHTFVNWWPSIITHRSNKPNVSSPKQNLNAHCLQMCVGKLISKLQSQTTNKSFTKKQKWKLGCAHTPHEIQIDYVTLHKRCVYF